MAGRSRERRRGILRAMRRWVFTILSALSLLLCVGVFGLLYRSYHCSDDERPTIEFTVRGERWAAAWFRGEVWLSNEPQLRLDHERRLAAVLAWRDPKDRLTPDEWKIAERLLSGRAGGLWWDQNLNRLYDSLLQKPGGAERVAVLQTVPSPYGNYLHPATNLVLILSSLFLPALWLIRAGRALKGRRKRRRKGLCLSCGYDLRHSPERCPECSAAAAVAMRPTNAARPPRSRPPVQVG